MYTLKVYEIHQNINSIYDSCLLKTQNTSLDALLNNIRGNALGLGKIDLIAYNQEASDEIVLVGKTEKGVLIDFVISKHYNILEELKDTLKGLKL